MLVAPVALAACDGSQNVLNPQGPTAEALAQLSWVLFIGAAVIFVVVMAMLAFAIVRREGRPSALTGNSLVIGGGLVFPIVTLTALLVYGFLIDVGRSGPAAQDPLRIEVVGYMWWWEVHYPGSEREGFVTANELHIPTGRTVEISVTSADVIHSFWVPTLAGKIDMIPGHVNTIRLRADKPGVVRGQCAEYCGAQHALMAFHVVVETPEQYREWVERQRAPADEPPIPFLAKGREAFLEAGCGACHAVRGTPANGQLGPDLTHVGSRLSIAAGTLDNHVGTLAGWIADAQEIKPDNRMPSFDVFDGETLRAISAYLESLK
ncbi:MAG TPA: cytochrome c oxidase subunit II [Alphaproteobacteria bacterium]|nr:cytochrome c oxidase subunit II [Alphaproteobacteria bacterium]